MTDTPHDALFKAAFESPTDAAGVFRGVLPPALADSIVWETLATEPGSFVDPDLAGRHSDLLFSAQMRGGRVLLYLLLEHQSTNDPDMPLRMLIYLVRIWERFRKESEHAGAPLPPIIPVVVSHAPGGWTAPRSFQSMFEPQPSSIPGLAELVPSFSMLVEDLALLSNDDIKGLALAAFPTLALWALRDARDAPQLLRHLGEWAYAFAEAQRSARGTDALQQLMRYISLVAEDLDLDEFRAKIRETPEVKDAAMNLAEQMRNEGREQGREQGHREMLRTLLASKFGTVTREADARIDAAHVEDLTRYAARVLVVDSLDAVFE